MAVAIVQVNERTRHTTEISSNRAPVIRLGAGSYQAAVQVPELGYGPVVPFEVAETEVEVHLAAPFAFDLAFPVLDSETERIIPNAKVHAQRSDVPSEWGESSISGIESDTNGQVRLVGMTQGRWRLTVSAPGYAETVTDFDYPGAQLNEALSEGLVTLRGFFLPALREIHFQLVNHRRWSDLSKFSISLTHEGDPVPFSLEGSASLTLGWFDLPLYVKVRYPDERECVRYLDGGLPAPDDVHEIEVGGSQRLDVNLEVTSDVIPRIEAAETLLTVSSRSSNGDATKVGLPVSAGGSYSFQLSDVRRAMVSIETVSDGEVTKWKSIAVEVGRSGVTSVTLRVDSLPLKLLVADQAGAPVEGFSCDIRQIPNDTTWVSGATTDENGIALVARMEGGNASLCGFKNLGTRELLVIDVPVDLREPGESVTFPLFPTESTFIEVRGLRAPMSGVDVEIVGSDSGTPYFWDQTGSTGRSTAFDLHTESRAIGRILLTTHWTPTPEFNLLPGRNAVTAYDTGQLRVTDRQKLAQILSLDFDVTLADWAAADNLAIDTTDGGAVLCRVPIGSYEVTPISGDPVRVDVRKGAVVPSGL